MGPRVRMAPLTFRLVPAWRVRRFPMRVVTTGAPEFGLRRNGTFTQRQLLGVRNNFEVLGTSQNVDAEYILQRHARLKIGESSSGVRNARDAGQMALLTHTVAFARREFRWINDVPAPPILRVRRTVPMASGAANGGLGNRIIQHISIQRARHRRGASRMAE